MLTHGVPKFDRVSYSQSFRHTRYTVSRLAFLIYADRSLHTQTGRKVKTVLAIYA